MARIDLNKHKELFLKEAATHINLMNSALIKLEKTPTETKLLEDIFRSVHGLKGISATMNYEQITRFCHAIEDVLDAIRNQVVTIEQTSDLLFQCFDFLNANIKMINNNQDELNPDSLIIELKNSFKHKVSKDSYHNYLSLSSATEIEKIKAIDVTVERLDNLMNLAEELLVCKMKFDLINASIENPELLNATEIFGRLVTDLQYHVLQSRLVPVQFIFDRFERMARDLAKKQSKMVDLQIEGGDIELDRLLIDELGESLTHLLRNAIDHGIETPETRIKLNKPQRATIYLRASRSKEMAIIEVKDDGCGLDIETMKSLAIKRHLFVPSTTTDDPNKIIFSGISTKTTVTDVSGRGLGLSIVKQKIESIGGSIQVETEPHVGTTFFIEIPITLAIIKTLFVKVVDQIYAIPTEMVERLLVVNPEEFKGILNSEAIIFEDYNIPVVRLAKIFGYAKSKPEKYPIVIIGKKDQRIGLVVDDLLSTQEVVIKPLCKSVKNNRYFSGAALTGSGRIILIIDAAFFLMSMTKESPSLVAS